MRSVGNFDQSDLAFILSRLHNFIAIDVRCTHDNSALSVFVGYEILNTQLVTFSIIASQRNESFSITGSNVTSYIAEFNLCGKFSRVNLNLCGLGSCFIVNSNGIFTGLVNISLQRNLNIGNFIIIAVRSNCKNISLIRRCINLCSTLYTLAVIRCIVTRSKVRHDVAILVIIQYIKGCSFTGLLNGVATVGIFNSAKFHLGDKCGSTFGKVLGHSNTSIIVINNNRNYTNTS
ncbi:hypothetical protein D3C75_660660 [compost metagenome]